jgi:hypothetical protein
MASIFLWPKKLRRKAVCPENLMELRLVIATFAWHFDAEFAEGQREPYYKDAFVVLRGALPVRIIPVQRK